MKPTVIEKPDFSALAKLITDNVSRVEREGRELKDVEQYAFELAMEAVYGPNVWEWWNKLEINQ